MYGVGIYFYFFKKKFELASIKEILLYCLFGGYLRELCQKFKGGGRVLFQFCHVTKVGIIPKMI
jgi:hypothetical protein